MKIKNIIIFSIISSLLLLSLISIWKILSTLQGVKLDNLNFQILFILGFLVTFLNVIIEKKINFLIRLFIFSFIFIFIDGYLIQNLPFWYNFGSFLIICLFFNKLKKYNNDFFINEHSTQTIIFDFLTLFGIVLFSFVILFPFYMMLVTSFKTQIALLVNPLDFSINFNQDIKELFKSYFVIFKSYKFGKYILTSTIVSLGTVLITLLFAIPAAYAIARLNFFGKSFMSTSILIIYMFPAIVLVIPLYTVFSQLGLRNSIFGLLIVYTATTLPVAIYMLQGYFKSIPKELEEAAILDKLSWFGIIIKIILPLSIPAISSVALYVFMIAWNEFLFSLMFLDNPNSFTLSRAIQYLSGDAETPRQYLMAGSVIVTLPVLFIFVYFEKYLVSGLTAGSVKG
jgi:multiple sugar transport system permease protein|tara:strand:- start:3039 stop:4232 length:1194 start_codon:yes stop_codon:yes gene_type:complete